MAFTKALEDAVVKELEKQAIVFMDTETLGLDKAAPIWEFAAVRRNADGSEEEYHCFVDHTPWKHIVSGKRWDDDMPEQFRADYQARYEHVNAYAPGDLVDRLLPHIYRGRAHTIGAVPNFDTERLGRICDKHGKPEPWHYHLIDIENVVVGFLAGRGRLVLPPWKSDQLSRLVGVDPEKFERHTAMGDVRWEMAQWDAVLNAEPEPEWHAGARTVLGDIPNMLLALRRGQIQPCDVPGELRDWWNGFLA